MELSIPKFLRLEAASKLKIGNPSGLGRYIPFSVTHSMSGYQLEIYGRVLSVRKFLGLAAGLKLKRVKLPY